MCLAVLCLQLPWKKLSLRYFQIHRQTIFVSYNLSLPHNYCITVLPLSKCPWSGLLLVQPGSWQPVFRHQEPLSSMARKSISFTKFWTSRWRARTLEYPVDWEGPDEWYWVPVIPPIHQQRSISHEYWLAPHFNRPLSQWFHFSSALLQHSVLVVLVYFWMKGILLENLQLKI